ncbi:hypothetical protein JL720_16470 [Aureococcus anophagefferens]|nr:hypothetical protein JL720_16470 [Aureococcus anophagefferens]
MLRSVDGCEPCFGGHYCETDGLGWPTGECAGGYYCGLGANVATPDEKQLATSIYQGETCADQSTEDDANGVCPRGHYCQGTRLAHEADCEPCSPGHYCGAPGLPEPQGPCEAGFYCALGSATRRPATASSTRLGEACNVMRPSETNGVCPVGHYCEEGSIAPTQCPRARRARRACCVTSVGRTAGYVCPESGTINATIPCPAKFSCPGGDIVATVTCPEGHYCAGGDAAPAPCEPGTYQNATAQDSCLDCPAGFYCEQATAVPQICPRGYACPAKTEYATAFPCPDGSFGNETMLNGTDQCEACTPGLYCNETGLAAPVGPCAAGYYCASGSNTSTPGDGEHWTYVGETCNSLQPGELSGVCPVGHYCEEGSIAPTQCPPGTESTARGLRNVSECPPCSAGFTCPNASTVVASKPCAPRFYCPGGDVVPTLLCSPGHFCDGGDPAPAPCLAGTYQDAEGQTDCKLCPAGYFCENATVTPADCPLGSYCPNGTRYGAQFLCAAYAKSVAGPRPSKTVDECDPCPPGSYCGSPGLAQPTGPCESGYYCASGSTTATPGDGATTRRRRACADQSDAGFRASARGPLLRGGLHRPDAVPAGHGVERARVAR